MILHRRNLTLPLLLIFLVFPYFALLRVIPSWQWPELGELLWALKNSYQQAAGSATLALLVAILLLPGYFYLPRRFRGPVAWILLSPSFFPPLFLLLSFLSWMNPFPFGLAGVILIQGFMNAGLLAVLMVRSLEEKWGGLIEMSHVFGASKLRFLRAAARGLLPEWGTLWLFVFAVSFASFSIPLVIGAGKATTLEILIYEKIRISNDWGTALSLSVIQLALIGLFVFLPRASGAISGARSRELRFWGSAFGFGPLILYVLIFWGPLLRGLPAGFLAIGQVPGLWEDITATAWLTFLIAIGTGLTGLALFLFVSFGGPGNGVPRVWRGWMAPSSALLGFAFLLWAGDSPVFYGLALVMIFFPAVARLGADRALESLRAQNEVARTLGASDSLIWRQILVPQLWPLACVLGGVIAIWSIGEFAVGKLILGRSATWSLLAESLMSSYRIEAGLGVSFLILAAGAAIFLCFWGMANVRR